MPVDGVMSVERCDREKSIYCYHGSESQSLLQAVHDMDVLVESTKKFEKDLNALGEAERAVVVQTVDNCANLFLTQKAVLDQKLLSLPLLSDLNGYESSLYILQVSRRLRAILAVDEDPLFEQVIFTFFRVVDHDDLDKAIKGVQESLYQDLLHSGREAAQIL